MKSVQKATDSEKLLRKYLEFSKTKYPYFTKSSISKVCRSSRSFKFTVLIPPSRYIAMLVFIGIQGICAVSFTWNIETMSFFTNWLMAYSSSEAKKTIYKMASLHFSISLTLFFIYIFDNFLSIH